MKSNYPSMYEVREEMGKRWHRSYWGLVFWLFAVTLFIHLCLVAPHVMAEDQPTDGTMEELVLESKCYHVGESLIQYRELFVAIITNTDVLTSEQAEERISRYNANVIDYFDNCGGYSNHGVHLIINQPEGD